MIQYYKEVVYMDANVWVQLISNLGFPIAMCAALLWYINKLTEQHKDEIHELKQTIDNNTLIVTKLYERLTNE